MRILISGAAGYIGSHVLIEVLKAGHAVVAVDDFSSGHREALRRAQALAGASCSIFEGDIGDPGLLRPALEGVDAVIHLAAFKKVGESMERPGVYFHNNVGAMTTLVNEMENAGVRRMIYSSSAAVYGSKAPMPLCETATPEPDSPYGLTKLQGEQVLEWMARGRGWAAVSLRYFNPVGAHPSGRIGEPIAHAASLVPCALRSLDDMGRPFTIFGTDYDTDDGTCLRDYIHVCDLASAHLQAIEAVSSPGHRAFNVGTGRPHSVREVLAACGRAVGRPVPVVEGARRPGDVPVAVADPRSFTEATGFAATRDLDEMVRSAWRWLRDNPAGYDAPHGLKQVRGGRRVVTGGGRRGWHLRATWSQSL